MQCSKCGMSPYLPTWYGERSCPCCGNTPEHGQPLPAWLEREKLSSLALNEGGKKAEKVSENDYHPQRVVRRGCRWWQGRLSDGTKKTCFNCGWGDCVKNDQIGEGTSKNYSYKSREAKGITIIYPDGAPRNDCYIPEGEGKEYTPPSADERPKISGICVT